MTLPIQALRVKLAAVAVGAVVLTGGHAVAKNHDCQAFKLASTVAGLHDRAPGPALRIPN
jgi:hypothetical protein